VLQAVARQLSQLLSSLVVWLARPEALGDPFDRLTDREWMVLRGLNSEAGEKQLADQLGLSPHTLHSHIKSIYRKVGVQGRLPLLLHAQQALRALRVKQVNGNPPAPVSDGGQRTALAV
jgi:DNA-binding NarL/FixJ family response regulator